MLFRGKKIADYTAADIQSLIDNKVPESKVLDYKRELQLGEEKTKTEMIYDISSFYNTEGGCIVVGLEEEKDEQGNNTGMPRLPDTKISVANYDGLKLKVEEIIRQTTNPPITHLSFSPLLSINGSAVFLIGIPKTSTLPAMVTYSNHNRFFKRKSSGKYSLDTFELYETFTQVSVLEERIAAFINERQRAVMENEFWLNLSALHSILIHIVPLSTFNASVENFSSQQVMHLLRHELSVPGWHSYSYRFCLEGFHNYKNIVTPSIQAHDIVPYNLTFRNGAIEGFTNELFFSQDPAKPNLYDEKLLTILNEQLRKAFSVYTQLSIDFPFYLSIHLHNTGNMGLVDEKNNRMIGERFQRNSLQLPIVLLTDDKAENKRKVKDIIDILWQAVGVAQCPATLFNAHVDVFD